MAADWSIVRQELARMRHDGVALPFWWRDDDAVSHTPALDQLFALSTECAVPLALAVVPKYADATVVQACAAHPGIVPLVHGWAHDNHAGKQAKKSEFPVGRAQASADARAGFDRLSALFGNSFAPVFVPPWNRIDPALFPALGQIGYRVLSTYGPRPAAHAAPGLRQINTHIDPIHWRAGGGLVPEEQMISRLANHLHARRLGQEDATEPLGLLTHHLVHDQAIWNFTETFIKTMLDGGAAPVSIRNHAEATS